MYLNFPKFSEHSDYGHNEPFVFAPQQEGILKQKVVTVLHNALGDAVYKDLAEFLLQVPKIFQDFLHKRLGISTPKVLEFVLQECVLDVAEDTIKCNFEEFVNGIVDDIVILCNGNGDFANSYKDFQRSIFIAYSAFQLEKKALKKAQTQAPPEEEEEEEFVFKKVKKPVKIN